MSDKKMKGLQGLLNSGLSRVTSGSKQAANSSDFDDEAAANYNESLKYDMPTRKYFDQWGQTAYEWLNLKFAMLIMAVITVLSIIFTIASINNFSRELMQRPVIAVPGAEAPGLYRPGRLPKVVVWDFARRFVMDLLNFDASRGIELETVSSALASARNYLSPEAKSRYAKVFSDLIRKTIQNRNSISFVPNQTSATPNSVIVRPDGRREVRVSGLLKKYVAGSEVSREEKTVRVILELVPATDINPYGLQIVSYEILNSDNRGDGGGK